MEISITGKTVLKDEFQPTTTNIIELFKEHKVYVFGYGSLLYPDGWTGRWMKNIPRDFAVTNLNNFERGPFGLYGPTNFYGIIRTNGKHLNGVIAHIKIPSDYYHLMLSEFVVGLYTKANYRIVDVTEEIEIDLPNNSVVHTVVNRPINRTKILISIPYPRYYDRVMGLTKRFHTEEFVEEFLNTGGFKDDREVKRYLEKGGNVNITGKC